MKIACDLLTLKASSVYVTFFFQTNPIRVILKMYSGYSKCYHFSGQVFLFNSRQIKHAHPYYKCMTEFSFLGELSILVRK